MCGALIAAAGPGAIFSAMSRFGALLTPQPKELPMDDSQLDNLYKQHVSTNHAAGLRACFEAGWNGAMAQKAAEANDAPASTPTIETNDQGGENPGLVRTNEDEKD